MAKSNPILEAVTDPTKNFLAFFFVGFILFNLFSDGISALFWNEFGGWLQAHTGIHNTVLFQSILLIGMAIIILVLIYATNLATWVKRLLVWLRVMDAIVPKEANVVPLTKSYRGLIVIMSTRDDSPAEVAIRHHWNNGQDVHLEHCWIICTPQTVEFTRKLDQKLVNEGISERLSLYYGEFKLPISKNRLDQPCLTIDDGFTTEPEQVLNLVNAIYTHAESLGLAEADLIVDFTGGTKPLGMGAFLACVSPERRLEYISQPVDPKIYEIKVAYRLKPVR
jgi:hypothetical protein